jgi:GntR family transcriptional regulator/MocR family aminotransferase
MGVPAPDIFPTTLFARIRAAAVRAETASPASHPDPRGEPELRREIAAHLGISRGIVCRPAQVFITGGFSGGMAAALLALGIEGGSSAWVEDPGFPISRRALEIAGLKTVSIAVDDEGIDVAAAIRKAPDASLALVTAGQQAPLGPTLSLARRNALLEWAHRNKSWIIEDDYLGELQLNGRAAPALAAIDAGGRVIHIGSFSKTISPTLRLGFVVVPPALAARFAETLSCLAPAPGPAVQKATAAFMQEGHYMRHLRRLKRTYASRRDSLRAALQSSGYKLETAGLAMLLHLPAGTDDVAVCRKAQSFGIGPAPLSPWYSGKRPRSGLLLSVATAAPERIAPACIQLLELIRKFG